MQVDTANYKLCFSLNKVKKKRQKFTWLTCSLRLSEPQTIPLLDLLTLSRLSPKYVQNIIHLGKCIPELLYSGKYLTVFPNFIFHFFFMYLPTMLLIFKLSSFQMFHFHPKLTFSINMMLLRVTIG